MSEPKPNQMPFKNLGLRLKQLREKLNESLGEVSGAVEIDPDMLASFEQGKHRPSEDVLLLLISHFDPQEEEAVRLWEMAGYDQNRNNYIDDNNAGKPIIMLMQPDNRIMYSDAVNVVANKQGVVLNFLQTQGQGQDSAVARVGMSREQAIRVIEAIQMTLVNMQQPPKSLPAPRQIIESDDSDK